jgi:hypothetical protein
MNVLTGNFFVMLVWQDGSASWHLLADIKTHITQSVIILCVAAKIFCTAFILSTENLADMLTKPLGANNLKSFCHRILD